MKKIKMFIELQNQINKQIDSKGEADSDLCEKLNKIGDSLNSHECELLIEMWNNKID